MDGSTMTKPPTRWDRAVTAARWMRSQFAEWFIGSWALIIGWGIIGVIFFNFLLMDGHFSRGLGEGSGVNPDRFQQVGWSYRFFAALFLVLALKLSTMGLKRYAWGVRAIGLFITFIVVLHATGFGLKALEGKRDTAAAVEAVATTTVQSNAELIVALEGRQDTIRSDLALAVEPLKARMAQLDKDGKFNEGRTDALQARVAALENAAQKKIDDIDDEILATTVSGGEAKVDGAEKLARNEEWAPLFVGLAQLGTWTFEPNDRAIYIAGVLFIIFWVLVGDAIVIFVPEALYRMHLQDAKNPKVKVSPETFKTLQEQADELARRMNNIDAGIDKALKTKGRKRRRQDALKQIADNRTEMAKREADAKQQVEDAISELNAEEVDEDEDDDFTLVDPPKEAPVEAEEPEPAEDELLLETEVEETPEEETVEEFHPPAVIGANDPPVDDEQDDQPKPLQAAE